MEVTTPLEATKALVSLLIDVAAAGRPVDSVRSSGAFRALFGNSEASMNVLISTNASLTTELEKAKWALASKSEECSSNATRVDTLTAELEATRRNLGDLKQDSNASMSASWLSTNASLTAELEKTKRALSAASNECDRNTTHIDTLSRDLEATKRNLAALQKDNATMTGDLLKARNDYNALTQQNRAALTQLDEARREKDRVVKLNQTATANAERLRAEANEQVFAVQKLEAQVADLKRDLMAARQSATSIAASNVVFPPNNDRIVQLEASNVTLTDQVYKLQSKLQGYEAADAALAAKLGSE